MNTERLDGKCLANPPPGQNIVISGVSGKFPNSHNFVHFCENLMNKQNLCDEDERRFDHGNSQIPRNSGKLFNLTSFDPGFFGLHSLQAQYLEPALRIILETSYEAIIDAGLSVQDLAGTNTGVFIGNCWSDTQSYLFSDKLVKGACYAFGTARSALPNYISYYLKLNGPSLSCDTACSSGIYAVQEAYRSLKEGRCDTAIVGAVSILLNPFITMQFARLGVLNINKECRPFDADASGYTRSESVCVVILQKSEEAKRIYAEVANVKCNNDGFKTEGIAFPSTQRQMELLEDVYNECGVSPDQIGFFEAHCSGTSVGDIQELNGIHQVFFGKGQRQEPLLIGSVKGNIGHGEGASGLNSLCKVLFAMDKGCIPPNIYFDKPCAAVGLATGRLKVVTERTIWPENAPYAGINSFGLGGANSHVLLKRYQKSNINNCDQIPRLVCFSGRSEECISSYQNALKENPNKELMRIFQAAFRRKVPNNTVCGYSIITEDGEIKRSMKNVCAEKPLYLCIGSQIKHNAEILKELSQLPSFSKSIDDFNEVLRHKNLLEKVEESVLAKDAMLSFSIQLSLINLLKALNLKPTYIYGTSFGTFSAAYANGALNFEEAILATYLTTSVAFKIPRKASKQLYDDLNSCLKSLLGNSCRDPVTQIVHSGNPFDYATSEYFVFNILNPRKTAEIKENSVMLSIDCNEEFRNNEVINLVKNGMKLEYLLEGIGRLYELGYELRVEEIYPKYNWPVDSGTPTASHLVKWNHGRKQHVVRFKTHLKETPLVYAKVVFDSNDHAVTYIKGHVIDRRNLFPASGYVVSIIDRYRTAKKSSFSQQIIQLENVQFHEATTFGDGKLILHNFIAKTGEFEIVEGDVALVTGTVKGIDELEPFDLPEFEESEVKLSHADVYKELRLRGYNYSSVFCGIHEICGNRAMIQWSNNYVAFLDSMIQFFVLQTDNRTLSIPTGIDDLILNAPAHEAYIASNKEDSHIPVIFDPNTNSIITHGIKIVGCKVRSILRRKGFFEPLLEVEKFVPNEANISLKDALCVNGQIILENAIEPFFDVLEQIEADRAPVAPIFKKSLEDIPFVLINIKIITQLDLKIKDIEIVTDSIAEQTNYLVFIGNNLLQRQDDFEIVLRNISPEGFLILFEDRNEVKIPDSLILITKFNTETSTLYMFRKTQRNKSGSFTPINMSENLSWLSSLQEAVKSKKNVLMYAENQAASGIVGLTNCLKREIQNKKISGYLLQDAPIFQLNSEFYQKQIDKNLSINVFKNGTWGTYRHLPLEEKLCEREHSFGNVLKPGDLNTLKWIEGPISSKNQDVIYIYSSALNFRDLATASGQMPIETITVNRMEQECIQGLEFSGRNVKGERMMGVVNSGAISTCIVPNQNMLWKVPDSWTMQEAASVPIVYSTVLLALKIRANVRRGESILIHSGAGGVGLAAINLALHYGLEVFTTVGSQEKRDYLLKNYPQLKLSNIGNSRDSSFEQMIYKNTNARGVDYVLNSLADEKLLASLRCLARNGTFFEIGKFDISKDTKIAVDFQSKGATFTGVMLDKFLLNQAAISKGTNKLLKLLQEGIDQGYIKPLPITTFAREQLQEAFRYIGSGKHIGKIIIKQRQEENDKNTKPKLQTFPTIPRTYFNPEASYIILGGLGGFGLELADWMTLRGARNILLSARRGLQNGYQQNVVRKLKALGANVEITMDDIETYSGCEKIYQQTTNMGDLEGIFNVAVDLRDGMFENLTKSDFEISLGPKLHAAIHFDNVTRKYCSQLKHFVMFSSVMSRGTVGQTNYCLANSAMERICEKRKADALPGLAIQWGAIGDVGLIAKVQKEPYEIVVSGTLQQRISSCLEVLDKFMQCDEPVVSSMIVAEKREKQRCYRMGDAVRNVLGIRDLNTVSGYATLPELGMDSMMAVEIRQLLEREFDVYFSPLDLKNLTMNKLIEMDNLECGPEIDGDQIFTNH